MNARESGASLVEILVAFGLTVAISAAAFALFDLHRRLARAQLDDSSLEQSQQAAHREVRRALRAAGRGGIARPSPGGPPQVELAVRVEADVAAGHAVGVRTAAAGTDVLTVRGLINGPFLRVSDYSFDEVSATGWVLVAAAPAKNVRQSLSFLQEAGEAGDDALLLASTVGSTFAVVALTEVTTSGRGRRRTLRAHFHADASRSPVAAAYLGLSSGGAWPAGRMDAVLRVGVLEEWRFYVQAEDERSGRQRRLVMGRFHPGTSIAWRRRNANLAQPLADDVVDLAVAVSEDADGGGFGVTLTTTASSGEPGVAALRVERNATSFVRLRNVR